MSLVVELMHEMREALKTCGGTCTWSLQRTIDSTFILGGGSRGEAKKLQLVECSRSTIVKLVEDEGSTFTGES